MLDGLAVVRRKPPDHSKYRYSFPDDPAQIAYLFVRSFTHSFIHSTNIYCAYTMCQATGNRAMNKKIKIPFFLEFTFKWEETDSKEITMTITK